MGLYVPRRLSLKRLSSPSRSSSASLEEAISLASALAEELPVSKAAKIAARITGESRRDVYAALEVSRKDH